MEKKSGGGGIRTHVGLASPTVFKTGPFSLSGTPPGGRSGIRTHVRLSPQRFSKPPRLTAPASFLGFYFSKKRAKFHLAKVKPQTSLTPFLLSTWPHSRIVEPVVQTSSKSKNFACFSNLTLGLILKAP